MKMERMSEQYAFIGYLHSLRDKEDRGPLAALRRGLGKAPGTVPETYPFVIPRTPEGTTRWEEDIYFIIASLFAHHPSADGQGDMGSVFLKLHQESQSESIEGRFVALLRCHKDDLPDHLRHAVSIAKSHDVPINWAELFTDLRQWNRSDKKTQRKWANSYWKNERQQKGD